MANSGLSSTVTLRDNDHALKEVIPPEVIGVDLFKPVDSTKAVPILTLTGAWIIQFCTFGYVNAFGVYQDYYTREFLVDSSASDISWIGSLQLFLMYAAGIFVGRAFDRGYFHHLEIAGSAIYVFSIFMLSLTRPNHYYQVFLSQGIGMGIGLGLTFLPSISIVSHHFKTRRALATGIVVTGASAGGILFPIMLNRLFQDPRVGFTGGVRASGGLIAGLMLLANFLMRTNPPPNSSKEALSWTEYKRIIYNGAYLWSIAGAFFTATGVFIPFFYLQLYAVTRGIDKNLAFYSLTILNAGSIAGRVLPPFFADKMGVYNVILPSILGCGAVLFGLFGVHNFAGVVVFGLLFGFFSGAYISLIPPLLIALCRDLNELGVRIGFAFSVVSIAQLVGSPIGGALLGRGQSSDDDLAWWRALLFAGVCIFSGLAFMTISRMLYARRKEEHKV